MGSTNASAGSIGWAAGAGARRARDPELFRADSGAGEASGGLAKASFGAGPALELRWRAPRGEGNQVRGEAVAAGARGAAAAEAGSCAFMVASDPDPAAASAPGGSLRGVLTRPGDAMRRGDINRPGDIKRLGVNAVAARAAPDTSAEAAEPARPNPGEGRVGGRAVCGRHGFGGDWGGEASGSLAAEKTAAGAEARIAGSSAPG